MFAFAMRGSLQHECGSLTGEASPKDEGRFGNMDYELAAAVRHVAEARRIVARRRARLVRLKALGRATLDQELTLQILVGSLALLESGAREFGGIAKFERPQRKLS